MIQLETLNGTLERITFQSEETGFGIFKVNCKGIRDLVTITGVCAVIHVGEYIEATGFWFNDKRYGRQFKANNIQVVQPTSLEGITKYLGSGLIKGIGPAFAKVLVKGFGDTIFDVIEQTPNKLLELDGIGPKRVATIINAWDEQKSVRNIMVYLQSHGVGTARATRIYKKYGDDAIAKIKDNPYCLAKDIHGIGFKTADQLALRIGIPHDSIIRAQAGVLHVIQEINSDGHCAIEKDKLIKASEEMLDIHSDIIEEAIELEKQLDNLIPEIINDKDCLYINWLYYAEVGVASNIKRLLNNERRWNIDNIDAALEWVQKQTGLNLSSSQEQSVRMAIENKVVCITGGPGVGKTTVVNSIIKIIKTKARVLLCAPTGRAAKRLSESTGLEAKTLHRLLEFDPTTGKFKHDTDNQLKTDLVVVDESSMIDVILMNSLLRAIPDHASILIVGDIDQLPSVGAGKVLADIIDSHIVPVARLTEIFRQAKTSQIIVNAHKINEGKAPFKTPSNIKTDFYTIHLAPDVIHDALINIVSKKIPQAFGFAHNDIQVLTPMHRGGLGAKSLNIELQKELNPNPAASITKFGLTIGVGDKVIQLVNNYDKEVFNGDLGIIKSIDHENTTVIIDFEDKDIEYDITELDEIDLAYATSIHKSQGSEYPVVVIPIAMQHYMLLQRNLIYTGVTRGKKLVILIGEAKAISMAVRNVKQNDRLTYLKQRLIT
ncbi:ATP-dependent RecD-like DNA helicase [Francisella sp. 19X1-34]|uniref:SF1B family DNA helicase RecD2 n=1 Tax=Francisella sp. 19X1-34 TaxID=3087177 RepID=UPI002E36DDC8|nr:ATP-dependent RecD-like DNA helicase [Francisella sp. 19X1-34]MED7789274.1 ATP-dependent RecD-like DNA helicase [Francisella sp. 19X1-34]